jgi:hypothetical protein
MLAELRQLDPKPGRAFEAGRWKPWCPTSSCASGGRRLADRAQCRRAAARARQPHLLCHGLPQGARRGGKDLPHRLPATANWLTKSLDQRAQTILKVASRDRQAAGRLPRPRHYASEADDAEDGGRRHRHARVDREPRHLEQVRATPRGLFEMKYFFTTGAGLVDGEADAFGRGRAPPHPPAHRGRSAGRHPVRRHHCRDAAEGAGHRGRAPHRREIPRGHEHPLLGHPPTAEARARCGATPKSDVSQANGGARLSVGTVHDARQEVQGIGR